MSVRRIPLPDVAKCIIAGILVRSEVSGDKNSGIPWDACS
jgi:hypothetical protein